MVAHRAPRLCVRGPDGPIGSVGIEALVERHR
jgi:hypothetical protein